MSSSDVCRSCLIKESARNNRHASGVWFTISRGEGNAESENTKGYQPTSTWRTDSVPRRVNVHQFHELEPTHTSTVTLGHPKITEAPFLVKRKLGSSHWDGIHEEIQGQKRDAAVCPPKFQSCPQSVSGGCCPNDRVCGTAGCLPVSTAPTSTCGVSGYFPCDVAAGGMCFLEPGRSQG